MPSSQPIRILYAEDDPATARLFQRALNRIGFVVDLASDGHDALEKYDPGLYHILVLDHDMPRMTGLELIRELSQRTQLPPTVMVTGAGNENVAVEAMKLGASDYVIKDMECRYLELIPAVLQGALERRKTLEDKVQTEKALRDSEERLRSALESMDETVIVIDGNGLIVDHYRPVTSKSPPPLSDLDIIGGRYCAVFPEQMSELLDQAMEDVARGASSRVFEYSYLVGDEAEWFLARVSRMEDRTGAFSGATLVLRDITERKRQEERARELRLTAERLRAEIDRRKQVESALRDSREILSRRYRKTPALLQSIDRSGNLVEVSDLWLETMGYTREEVIGKPALDFYTPESAKRAREINLPTFFEQGSVKEIPYKFVKADGRIMDVLLSSAAEWDNNGEFERSLAVLTDVTEHRRAERSVRQFHDMWEKTFDAAPDLIMIMDKHHRMLHYNRATAERLGLPQTHSKDLYCYEVFHGTDSPIDHCPCSLLFNDLQGHRSEIFEPRINATLDVSATPLFNEDRELIGCVHVARDISRRKAMEEELDRKILGLGRANEELTALLEGSTAILESSDFSAAARRIFDIAKRITGATAGYVALLNKEGEETELLFVDPGGEERAVNPARLMPIPGLSGEAYRTLKVVWENDFPSCRYHEQMPEGHMILQNVLVAPLVVGGEAAGAIGLANKPEGFTEYDGKLVVALAEFTAIAFKKSEDNQALKDSELRFRQLAENVQDVFWMANEGGSWGAEYVSPAFEEVWGISRDRICSGSSGWFDSVDEADRERVQRKYAQFVSGTEDYDIEYRIRRPDNSIRWIWDRAFPIMDQRGAVLRIAGLAQDITDRKDAQAQQRELNDEIQRFAYIVSHDLRAPLGNIRGFTREIERACEYIRPVVERAVANPAWESSEEALAAIREDVPEAIEFMRASVSRMDRLIDGILKLSKMGRSTLDLQLLDMSNLAKQTLESLAHEIEQSEIRIEVGDLPDAVADRSAMEHVMANLLENAIKYLDESRPGVITLDGWRQGEEIVYRIQDNGIGVEKEDLDRIFLIFQRGRNTRKNGDGIGLAFVRALLRRHGGRIWCESAESRGTVFTFTIPAPLESS